MSKRGKAGSKDFVVPVHREEEMSPEEEYRLRVSCQIQHLRFRHPFDLALLLKRLTSSDQEKPRIRAFIQKELQTFLTVRDRVDLELAPKQNWATEDKLYLKRLVNDQRDLYQMFSGDLAHIIVQLITAGLVRGDDVSRQLQRINIQQSKVRGKLRPKRQ